MSFFCSEEENLEKGGRERGSDKAGNQEVMRGKKLLIDQRR